MVLKTKSFQSEHFSSRHEHNGLERWVQSPTIRYWEGSRSLALRICPSTYFPKDQRNSVVLFLSGRNNNLPTCHISNYVLHSPPPFLSLACIFFPCYAPMSVLRNCYTILNSYLPRLFKLYVCTRLSSRSAVAYKCSRTRCISERMHRVGQEVCARHARKDT